MLQTLVLTVIGPDRPGLVGELSSVVRGHGGNWLESRMVKLAGQFAGVVRVAVPTEQAAALGEALRALASEGLMVTPTPDAGTDSDHGGTTAAGGSAGGAASESRGLSLEFMGPDRPGIIREITAALAAHGLNIVELTSCVGSAPMTGDAMFTADVALTAPAGVDLAELNTQLDAVAAAMGLDLTLTE